ncbi:hypothetical protein B0J11DRAFT_600918 [Dendryphion nanum]|uniref:Uncharacterized protein n=1 Tax=Dendryphion nanum TaxID=256645 RepID=A0A9P9E7U5_9PLEO|nr:hypothetical protein B0J11DRAFT_600918 [Dendryphion nanum]
MSTVGEPRTSRMKKLMLPRRWRAPRPPTPRWRSIRDSEKAADIPRIPALSFFEPDTPIAEEMPAMLPQYQPASPFELVNLLNAEDEGDVLIHVDTCVTDDSDEVDTLSQLGSGTLTPWHSPMSYVEDREDDDIEELELEKMNEFIPLEVTLPSPLFSPRWMFPRSPPCPPLTRSPSSLKSPMAQSHVSSGSTSSTISSISLSASSCSTAPTSRCPSTCETELEVQIPSPFKLRAIGWDMDSPVRLHFGSTKRNSGALRASIIERRLGIRDDGEGGGGRRLGISVDLVRQATTRREQAGVRRGPTSTNRANGTGYWKYPNNKGAGAMEDGLGNWIPSFSYYCETNNCNFEAMMEEGKGEACETGGRHLDGQAPNASG